MTDFTDKEFRRTFYLQWIKDETNNYTLTGLEPGVFMAIEKLIRIDPEEFLSTDFKGTKTIKSKKIGQLQVQYGKDETSENKSKKEVPTSIYDWLKPYRKLKTL